jgi:hypothetical protein
MEGRFSQQGDLLQKASKTDDSIPQTKVEVICSKNPIGY